MKELTISQLSSYRTFGKMTSQSEFYKVHYPILLSHIKIRPISNKLNELLYIVQNNITNKVTCTCNNRVDFKSIKDGYKKFCSIECQKKYLNSPKKEIISSLSNTQIKEVLLKIKPDNYHKYNTKVMEVYGSIPKITNKVSKNIYLFINNLNDEPKCLCGNSRGYISFGQGYRSTCAAQKCRVINYRNIKLENDEWVEEHLLKGYTLYCRNVYKITEAQQLETLKNIEKRGRGLGKYNVDHRYSKIQGFKNNIPPFIIGNIVNLKMLTTEDNCSKNHNCSITKLELYESFYA